MPGKGSIFNRLDSGGTGAIKSVEGWIVFATNINEEATEEDIIDRFSAYGAVKNLQLPLDRRSGYVKGYVLVEYENKSEAEKAIREENGSEFMEKTISVDWAFSVGRGSTSGSGGIDRSKREKGSEKEASTEDA